MKLKSKVLVTALATFLCFLSVAYVSCKKNSETFPCNGKTCFNGGVCDTGRCVCPFGYENDSCSKGFNNKFLGRYSVTETVVATSNGPVGATKIFTTNITAGATPTSVLMDNWHGNAANVNVVASVDTITTHLTMNPYQSPTDPQYNIGGGKDTLSGTNISGRYWVTYNNAQNQLQTDTVSLMFQYMGPVQ